MSLFKQEPTLPDGVREAARLAGYRIDWLAPKYVNGARVANSGGYQIVNEDGMCMRHVRVDATFDEWLSNIGEVLDYVRSYQEKLKLIVKVLYRLE